MPRKKKIKEEKEEELQSEDSEAIASDSGESAEESPAKDSPSKVIKKADKKELPQLDHSSASIPELIKHIETNQDGSLSEGVKLDSVSPGSDAETMLRSLCSQPKVRTMIPLGIDDKRGTSFDTVILDGLRFNILKGYFVDLPQQVAQVLQDSFYQTQAALNEAIVKNPFTGKVSPARIDMKGDDRAF